MIVAHRQAMSSIFEIPNGGRNAIEAGGLKPLQIAGNCWLGRQDSNLRMPVPKTGALPLGDAPAGSARLAGSFAAGKSL